MNSGLLDPVIVSVVFAPLLVTLALLFALAWRQMRNGHTGLDTPGRLLAAAVRAMPDARREWGAAMLADWDRFAMGRRDGALRWTARASHCFRHMAMAGCNLRRPAANLFAEYWQ